VYNHIPLTILLYWAVGWGHFQIAGLPLNNGDLEPGRCRRTDGKKWRCAKNAVPDHKYCERHMVRSRHRSRKPVEKQNVPVKLSTEPEGAGKVETSVSRSSAALLGRYALVSYSFFFWLILLGHNWWCMKALICIH
jgi:WRC